MIINEASIHTNLLIPEKQQQQIIALDTECQMSDSETILQDANCYIYQQKDEFINERLEIADTAIAADQEEEESDERSVDSLEEIPVIPIHPRLRACTVLDPERVFLSRHRTYSERIVQTSTATTESTVINYEGIKKLQSEKTKQNENCDEEKVDEDEKTDNCIKNMINNNNNNNIKTTTTTTINIYEYGINSARSSLSTSFDDEDDSRDAIFKISDGSTTESSDEEDDILQHSFNGVLETREELTEDNLNRRQHEKPADDPPPITTTTTTLNSNHPPKKGRSLLSRDRQGFIKRKRTRPKLISNAGNPLWTSIGDCRWKAANGRQLEINPTTLSKLGDPERSMLKQLSFAKLQAFDLRCHLSYPKEGTTQRKAWRPIHSLKKKLTTVASEKEPKRNHSMFSIPIAQVVANDNSSSHSADKKLPKRTSDVDLMSSQRLRSNTLAVESIVARSQSFHSECGEQQEGSQLVMSSISRLIESRKEFTSMEDVLQPSKRQSRLLDALSLSSSTASSLCILDRVEELAPSPPQIPNIVLRSVEFLENHGLEVLGIFRNGGSKKRVRQMREDFDQGKDVVFDKETNPHDVATLFKEFFRLLPDPLLTRELYTAFIGSRRVNDESMRLLVLKYLVRLLPVVNRDSLALLLGLLQKVASCAEDRMDGDKVTFHGNKMDSRNLATLIGPNILHNIKSSSNQMSLAEDGFCAEENQLMIEVVKEMIELNSELFEVSATEHDEVLQNVMECDPETVDYVLRKKASRSKLLKVNLSFDEEKALQPPPRPQDKHARSMSIGVASSRSRLSDEIRYLLSRVKRSSEDNTAAMASRRRKLSASNTRPESLQSTKAEETESQTMSRKALSANSSFSKGIPIRDHHRFSGRRSSDGRKRDSGVDTTLKSATDTDDQYVTLHVDSAEDLDLSSSARFRRSLTRSSGRGRDSAYESGRGITLCRLPSIPGNSIQTSIMNEEEASTDSNRLKVQHQQIKLHHCKSIDSTTLSEVLDQPSFVMPPCKSDQKKRNISLPSYTASGVSLSITPVTPLSSPAEVSSPVEEIKWADWPKPAEIPGQETDL